MGTLHSNFKLHSESHFVLCPKRADEDEEGLAELFFIISLAFQKERKKKVFY